MTDIDRRPMCFYVSAKTLLFVFVIERTELLLSLLGFLYRMGLGCFLFVSSCICCLFYLDFLLHGVIYEYGTMFVGFGAMKRMILREYALSQRT